MKRKNRNHWYWIMIAFITLPFIGFSADTAQGTGIAYVINMNAPGGPAVAWRHDKQPKLDPHFTRRLVEHGRMPPAVVATARPADDRA